MNILFIGCVKFSEASLKKLIDMKANICGVITKKESSFNADFVDISYLAKMHNIPYFYTENVNDIQTVNFIKELNPDVIYCFGWSQIIKNEILEIPKLGVIGFHPAPLPKNRGRHPIIWTLFLGLDETASTFFFMDEGADSGDIISQKIIAVDYEDDANSLYNKITETALVQIEEFTHQLMNGDCQRVPQNNMKANYWRKRNYTDGIIDFRMSSRAIYNLVRALTHPYIGADVRYRSKLYKVWKIREYKTNFANIEHGQVLKVEGKNILVKCYENAVWLIEHELPDTIKEGEYLI
ncbi:formyl transferase [Dissulfurispira thermophila]|uniref:Formyl transferase n=2 Tax=root TaxID=1 RepID=A0A7G1H2B9_9BACT|nr:formyltransferase family protein [Dissulfurispira thermophila]BCB96332.1 formyl transferase [Dissulfurispira thermophila]